eukprot:m.29923 g.29923  ORF g.29923 m.29923 type:complete len:389 (+) comp8151_c0_seq1:117-1283(+)
MLLLLLLSVNSLVPLISGDTFQRVLLTTAAAQEGAVCIDGSAPAYYIHEGYGTGKDKWIFFQEGGGWCPTVSNCASRALTALGSSITYPPNTTTMEPGNGLFSLNQSVSPFYNWNLVYAKYCDGQSFSGNLDDPVKYGNQTLYFRGWRVFNAMMDDLTAKGMGEATDAIIAGCSAGGLATYIHCDHFAERFAGKSTKVRCIADAGYFPDFKSTSGTYNVRNLYNLTVTMANVTVGMNQACYEDKPAAEKYQCFFPEYLLPYLKTPIFALQSGYDSWQSIADWFSGDPSFQSCALDFTTCTAAQMKIVQGYHQAYLEKLSPILNTSSPHGAFVDSCHVHCQSGFWDMGTTPLKVSGYTRASAINAWYEGSKVKLVDVLYPGNPTCSSKK